MSTCDSRRAPAAPLASHASIWILRSPAPTTSQAGLVMKPASGLYSRAPYTAKRVSLFKGRSDWRRTLLAANKWLSFLAARLAACTSSWGDTICLWQPKRLTWRLTAKRGHGPYVPVSALLRRWRDALVDGSEQRRGVPWRASTSPRSTRFRQEAEGLDIHPGHSRMREAAQPLGCARPLPNYVS